MAYTPNTLKLMTGGLSGSHNDKWIYDTTDANTVWRATGYISDAKARGMKQGDEVTIKTRASLPTGAVTNMYYTWVLVIDASGAADLVDGVEIPATNT